MLNEVQFSNLSYETTDQILLNYFSKYDRVEKLILYKDDQNQSLRKGYLVYKNKNSIDELMSKRPHFIDNRQIFLQRKIPVDQYSIKSSIVDYLSIQLTVKEIFISRLCSSETKSMLYNYFQRFGKILNCQVYRSNARNPKQMGYAFIRFEDYDSVDQIILSRPHVINSRKYHVRKCIPKEYNYIVSSVKPICINKPMWHHYAFGLINMHTKEIIYPTSRLADSAYQSISFVKNSNDLISMNTNPTNDFELLATSSLSSSISIINSIVDDFT